MSENINRQTRIILASGSPRRRELLTQMGYKFEIQLPDVDENVSGKADEIVLILSRRKAKAVAEKNDSGIIIAADTLVSLNGEALGKPIDEVDAYRMLHTLSGNTHEVFTGVTIIDAKSGKCESKSVRTGVCFRKLSDSEIHEYIASGKPMDKAGAYGIQGGAGKFVEKLEGSYDNVIGFPTKEVRDMLEAFLREAAFISTENARID